MRIKIKISNRVSLVITILKIYLCGKCVCCWVRFWFSGFIEHACRVICIIFMKLWIRGDLLSICGKATTLRLSNTNFMKYTRCIKCFCFVAVVIVVKKISFSFFSQMVINIAKLIWPHIFCLLFQLFSIKNWAQKYQHFLINQPKYWTHFIWLFKLEWNFERI